MKKHYFFIVLITAGLFNYSCKKQYSCQCVTTFTQPGSDPYSVSSKEPINAKTTKKRADQICSHSEKQLYKNSLDYKYGSETVTSSCYVR